MLKKKEQSKDEEQHIVCCDGKYTAQKNDSGLYIYKANESELFKQGTKTLKKKYSDLPRFKIINEFEDAAKKEYEINISNTVIEIVKKIKSFTNEK